MKRLTSILLLVCVVSIKGFCAGPEGDSLAERLRRIEKIYLASGDDKVSMWERFIAEYPYSKYPYADYVNGSKEARQYFFFVEQSLAMIFFNKKDWSAMNRLLHDCPFELLNDVYTHYIIFDLRLDQPLISSEETLALSVSIVDSFFRRLGDPDGYISGRGDGDPASWSARAIRENRDILGFHAGLLDQHGRYVEGLKYAEMVRPYVGVKNATFNKTYMDLLSNLRRDKDVMAYRALLRTPADIEAEHAEIRKSMIDLPAPDFDVLDTEGNHVSMSGQRGRIVVIDFWATWCYYCKLSMPGMQMAVNKYKG
ncbi:MAG TPA: TlpA disulfide reductase family protein, partial [Puia sp.]|nr:TlpA disulfide reductase family protein [Puia sp.]